MKNRCHASEQQSYVWVRSLAGFLAALLLVLGPVRAEAAETQSLDDRYLQIFRLIDQGDDFGTNNVSSALAKYREAERRLLQIKRNYPNWSPDMVSFRLNYLAKQIAALSRTDSIATSHTTVVSQPRSDVKTAAQSGPFRLLNAGAEPRQVLRFRPEAGAKQKSLMTLKIGMDMGMGMPINMPAITLTFDSTVKEVSPEGDITFELTLGEVGVAEDADAMPQIAEAMKAVMGGMKGLRSGGTISDRGVTKDVEVSLPAETDAQAQQMMGNMKEALANLTILLPEEAVGPGAKWEVKQPVKSQDMTISQSATYELLSLDGTRLHVKTTIAQSAANQKIENAAMPGMKMDVTRMTGSVSGEATLDLGQLMPSQASMSSHTEMNMAIDAGGRKQPMLMKTDINMRLEGK
jgi:hypothetical protein